MAKGKKELTVLVMVAMAVVVMSSMGGGVAAAPSFPLDCSSFVLDAGPVPGKVCCIEVQDQFLLKKSVGIGGYCKAVTSVKRFNGPLQGTELDLALSIPSKCGLSGYHAKGVQCAGTSECAPFVTDCANNRESLGKSSPEEFSKLVRGID